MEINDSIIPSGDDNTQREVNEDAAIKQASAQPEHIEHAGQHTAAATHSAHEINAAKQPSTDWVWGAIGAFFGLITAYYISGSILWAILGAILGLIFGAWFLNSLVKGRNY